MVTMCFISHQTVILQKQQWSWVLGSPETLIKGNKKIKFIKFSSDVKLTLALLLFIEVLFSYLASPKANVTEETWFILFFIFFYISIPFLLLFWRASPELDLNKPYFKEKKSLKQPDQMLPKEWNKRSNLMDHASWMLTLLIL